MSVLEFYKNITRGVINIVNQPPTASSTLTKTTTMTNKGKVIINATWQDFVDAEIGSIFINEDEYGNYWRKSSNVVSNGAVKEVEFEDILGNRWTRYEKMVSNETWEIYNIREGVEIIMTNVNDEKILINNIYKGVSFRIYAQDRFDNLKMELFLKNLKDNIWVVGDDLLKDGTILIENSSDFIKVASHEYKTIGHDIVFKQYNRPSQTYAASEVVQKLIMGEFIISPLQEGDKLMNADGSDVAYSINFSYQISLFINNKKWDYAVSDFLQILKNRSIMVVKGVQPTTSVPTNVASTQQTTAVTNLNANEFEIGHIFIINDKFYRLRLINGAIYYFNCYDKNDKLVAQYTIDEIEALSKSKVFHHLPLM
jgi:hypothetical protein